VEIHLQGGRTEGLSAFACGACTHETAGQEVWDREARIGRGSKNAGSHIAFEYARIKGFLQFIDPSELKTERVLARLVVDRRSAVDRLVYLRHTAARAFCDSARFVR
jgi:hypothetical protein